MSYLAYKDGYRNGHRDKLNGFSAQTGFNAPDTHYASGYYDGNFGLPFNDPDAPLAGRPHVIRDFTHEDRPNDGTRFASLVEFNILIQTVKAQTATIGKLYEITQDQLEIIKVLESKLHEVSIRLTEHLQ